MPAFVSSESMWLATSPGRRLVSQRSTAAITCWGQRYGRASGGLVHSKPNVAPPTLALNPVVVARRPIGEIMTVGAQAIGRPVGTRGGGRGGFRGWHFSPLL